MGVFTRPDSKYWWLYLPTAPKGQQKERTNILMGTTPEDHRDSRKRADGLFYQRMTNLATNVEAKPPTAVHARGYFTRPDSQYYYLWLPTAPAGQQKEKTAIVVGMTVAQRADSRILVKQLYHQRMNELARHVHRMPKRHDEHLFRIYATRYATDTIATRKGASRELEILKQLRVFFDRYALSQIDRDLVKAYWKTRLAVEIQPARDGQPARKVTPSTINREVDLLKGMLRDAVGKYLDASPLAGMARLKGPKVRKRRLLGDEEARLLAVGDVQDRALLIVAADTLLRLGNVLDLQRTDRIGDWLTVRDSKNGEPYEVPLSERAAAALDEIPNNGKFYFSKFRRALNPRDWRSSVRQRLESLCQIATPPVPFGQLAGGVTFHGATRKTGATRLLQGAPGRPGLPVKTVQQLGNWKTASVLLDIYTEAERSELLAAVRPSKTG